jgi:UDP-glucuronate 4-epimerase
VSLSELVGLLEASLGVKAQVEHLAEQAGDVPITWADIEKARRLLGYQPAVKIEDGMQRFASWLETQGTGAN